MTDKNDESPSEFVADVEGIGQFLFAKRTMRLDIKAAVELRRLTEGVLMDEYSMTFMQAIADLKVLTLDGPKDYRADELDDLDPYNDRHHAAILLIWGALREKERSFRRARA
ncbi:MAG TPA: hypothetical protein VJP88_04580 [Caulobacteraceae bacterium]|nr:hypothetical protein [Caulobacteraceae bacterium]